MSGIADLHPWEGRHEVIYSSAPLTATGNSGVLAGYGPATRIRAQLNVTAVAGTNPTLDVVIEDTVDGTTFNTLTSFTQATGVTREVKNITAEFTDRLRATYTLGGTSVAATLTTALTGTNNDVDFTAVTAGAGGNSVTIAYVDPAAASQALAVVVVGNAITVNLATNGSSVITSTAAQIKTAIDASTPAHALVTLANHTGNDGSGVVTAMAATPLAGGVTCSVTFQLEWVVEGALA